MGGNRKRLRIWSLAGAPDHGSLEWYLEDTRFLHLTSARRAAEATLRQFAHIAEHCVHIGERDGCAGVFVFEFAALDTLRRHFANGQVAFHGLFH